MLRDSLLGKAIRNARLAQNLTKLELAKKADLVGVDIDAVENGLQPISEKNIKVIASILRMPANDDVIVIRMRNNRMVFDYVVDLVRTITSSAEVVS